MKLSRYIFLDPAHPFPLPEKFIRHLSHPSGWCETKSFGLVQQDQKPCLHFAPCYLSAHLPQRKISEFTKAPAYLIPYRVQCTADLYSNAVCCFFISRPCLCSPQPDAAVKPYLSTGSSARHCHLTVLSLRK